MNSTEVDTEIRDLHKLRTFVKEILFEFLEPFFGKLEWIIIYRDLELLEVKSRYWNLHELGGTVVINLSLTPFLF